MRKYGCYSIIKVRTKRTHHLHGAKLLCIPIFSLVFAVLHQKLDKSIDGLVYQLYGLTKEEIAIVEQR